MQLSRKSKTSDIFERVHGQLNSNMETSAIVPIPTPASEETPRALLTTDHDPIHVSISEGITAKMSREGALRMLTVSGDLSLQIADPSLTKIKLGLQTDTSHGAQFRTHPNVDRGLFNSSKIIQMSNAARGFPVNNPVGVLRWRASPEMNNPTMVPITFTVWINHGFGSHFTMTIEYELTGGDALSDVSVSIPFMTSEPSVSSFDATYEISEKTLNWTIGTVNHDNPSGSFEFEGQAEDENEFFPIQVGFCKTTPFINVDVSQ